MSITRGKLPPVSPGKILKEEFMDPMELSMNSLGEELGVPPNRISQIVNGKRAVTASTALRLAAFFGTSPQFWLNLQSLYDLEIAERAEAEEIKKRVRRMVFPATARSSSAKLNLSPVKRIARK